MKQAEGRAQLSFATPPPPPKSCICPWEQVNLKENSRNVGTWDARHFLNAHPSVVQDRILKLIR